MSEADDWEPSALQRDLLLDVVEQRRTRDDPEVRAAMAAEPRFAPCLEEALRVIAALERLQRDERDALAAPPGPLDALAVATARARLGLPPKGAATRSMRRWPWLVLALAACLTLGVLLWHGLGSSEPEVPIHLGGTPAVQLTFEGDGLRFAPAPEPGQYYRIEFESGGRTLPSLVVRRSDRLSGEDLRRHGDEVRVRAVLMQGDEVLARSEFAPVPPGTGR